MPSFSLCTQWWVSIARIVAVAAQDMCGHHIDSVVDFFASVLLTIFMVVMMMMTTTTTITSTRIVRFMGYDVKYEYTMWLYDDNGNDDGVCNDVNARCGKLIVVKLWELLLACSFFVTRYGKFNIPCQTLSVEQKTVIGKKNFYINYNVLRILNYFFWKY